MQGSLSYSYLLGKDDISSVPDIDSIGLSDVADGVHLLLKVSVAFRCPLGLQQISQPTIKNSVRFFFNQIKTFSFESTPNMPWRCINLTKSQVKQVYNVYCFTVIGNMNYFGS